jgi:hypothetical protein
MLNIECHVTIDLNRVYKGLVTLEPLMLNKNKG